MTEFYINSQTLLFGLISLAVGMLVFKANELFFTKKRPLDDRAWKLSASFSQRNPNISSNRVNRPVDFFKNIFSSMFHKLQVRVQKISKQNLILENRMLAAGIRVRNGWIYLVFLKLTLPVTAIGLTFFYDAKFSLFLVRSQLYFIGIAFLPLVLFFLPDIWLRIITNERITQIRRHWQDALDLMIICLEAGLTVETAMRRVSHEIASSAPALAEELVITISELTLLSERRQAYANLSKRVNIPPVRATVVVLIQAEQQGASVSRSLRSIATANRQDVAAEVDRKAAALGAKMTIPMILFFLPVVFVIMLAPFYLNG